MTADEARPSGVRARAMPAALAIGVLSGAAGTGLGLLLAENRAARPPAPAAATQRPHAPAAPALPARAVRFTAAIPPAVALGGSAGPAPLVRGGPLSFAPLARRVVPAVVNIAVTESVAADPSEAPAPEVPPALRGTPFEKQFRDKMRARREQVLGAGSGFIIDPSGVIVTNDHVVGSADRIVVSLADGSQLDAKLLGTDELTDIAVIKVEPKAPLAFVPWGDSGRIEIGDWILAAGNPFGLGSSVTAGIVSARGRDIGAGPFDDFLQLDAPINPGNSGGPSFNLSGQVVALNTAIVSPTGGSVGIGFAIPSAIVAPIVAQLRASGRIERGWLGVSVRDGAEAGDGVLIADVDRAGPAARAGLHGGDTVTAVEGVPVGDARTLIRAVARATPGSAIDLTVLRHGRPGRLAVVVGRRPAEHADD